MRQVHPSERPHMISRINRSMSDAGMLDPNIDLKASPEDFGRQAFLENMSIENRLQDMNLPNIMGADNPEELANRVLPNDGHLE
jgi:hypothetical protein